MSLCTAIASSWLLCGSLGRRFDSEGLIADLWRMRVDGTEQQWNHEQALEALRQAPQRTPASTEGK